MPDYCVARGSTREIDVRRALYRSVLKSYCEDPDALVIDELGLMHGDSRVDVAVINGELHGFEIKSARDTLERLPSQVCAYSAVFDYVTLVADPGHIKKALDLVPEWWGLIEVQQPKRRHVELTVVRAGVANQRVDPLSVARLLWREEALKILEEKGADAGVRSKPRIAIYERLVGVLSLDELKGAVRDWMKQRTCWRSDRLRK